MGALMEALALLLGAGAVQAEEAVGRVPRAASINLCTDQLLVAVADPAQIAGLSPYFRDEVRSWAAGRVPAGVPVLSGGAEDVLVLKPDLVLAGRFTRRATRELLRAKGIRVEEFDVVRSLDDARRTLRIGDRYVVLPTIAEWGFTPPAGDPLPDGFAYQSDSNDQWLDAGAIRDVLETID